MKQMLQYERSQLFLKVQLNPWIRALKIGWTFGRVFGLTKFLSIESFEPFQVPPSVVDSHLKECPA
jgi:hypothetical protein